MAPKLGRKALAGWHRASDATERYMVVLTDAPRAVQLLWEVEPKFVETNLTPPSKEFS